MFAINRRVKWELQINLANYGTPHCGHGEELDMAGGVHSEQVEQLHHVCGLWINTEIWDESRDVIGWVKYDSMLVGGLEHGFYDFPSSWEWNNHPNWLSLHHFSEG